MNDYYGYLNELVQTGTSKVYLKMKYALWMFIWITSFLEGFGLPR